MRELFKRFRHDTQGAISVDWVVLTAGVIALAAGAASVVFDGSQDLSEALRSTLSPTEDGSGSAATKP